MNIVPVDELKNSVGVVGIGVATRLRLRSNFAHDNKLKIDDKTMTIATFIFAVSKWFELLNARSLYLSLCLRCTWNGLSIQIFAHRFAFVIPVIIQCARITQIILRKEEFAIDEEF